MARIRATHLAKRRDDVTRIMAALNDDALRTVEYRASIDAGPDGFGSGATDGPPSSDVTSSTESAALRLIEGRREADPQLTACQRLDEAFRECHRAAKEAEMAWQFVKFAAKGKIGRAGQSTITECQACERDVAQVDGDRLRSGYCAACYSAWSRAGRPDRLAFERRRRMHAVDEVAEAIPALQESGALPKPREAK